MKYVKLWAVDDGGVCKCPNGPECPPKRRGKHPVGASWEVHELEELELGPEYNWGLVTGEVNGIIVVDCDVHGDVNGVAALGALGTLPTTYTVKTGSGGLHYYLKWPGAEVSNSASKLAPGVDVRGDGGYVLVPPSRNAKGPYTVVSETPIADAPAWLLQRLSSKPSHLHVVPDAPIEVSSEDIAAARAEVLMMAPAVDGKGGDNQTYIVAATLVNDYALPEEIGFPIFQEWNARCLPPWSEKDLLVKYRNGSKYASGKRGVKLTGGLRAAVKEQLARWRGSNLGAAGLGALVKGLERAARENPIVDKMVLDNLEGMVTAETGLPARKQGLRVAMQSEAAANSAADNRKVIIWEQDALDRCATAAEDAVANGGQDVYWHGGRLVHPNNGKFKSVDVVAMIRVINRVARIDQYSSSSQRYVAINPPTALAQQVLSSTSSPIPRITGILPCPSIRQDGTIVNTKGVDSATGMFLEAPMDLPPVGETRGAALAAMERLLGIIKNSRFETEVDRSVALSLMMTPVCHAAYDTSPGHGVTAAMKQSGKSALIEFTLALALGGKPTVMDMAKINDGEEFVKALKTKLLTGPKYIAIDNVERGISISHPFLCELLTQADVDFRILGGMDEAAVSKRCILTANGNNLRITSDDTRRWLMCNLFFNPDRKGEFDPLERVLANRPGYISDVLTIVRAFIVQKGEKLEPFANFRGWSDTVRSAMVWLGRADPVQSTMDLMAGDDEQVIIGQVMTWWRSLGLKGSRPKEWLALATTEEPEWLEDVAGRPPSAKRLALWLKSHTGIVVGGYEIAGVTDKHLNTTLYNVVPAQRRLV